MSRPAMNIAILEVTDDEDDINYAALTPTSSKYVHVSAGIHRAAKMLATDRAKRQLAILGVEFDVHVNNGTAFGGKLNSVKPKVDTFLRLIQSDFPAVVIDRDMPEDAYGHHTREPYSGSFIPRNQAIHISAKMINDMGEVARARNIAMWERYQFWLTCTLVHEMAHVFITYLYPCGNLTPTKISHPCATEEEGHGEAGAFYEMGLFGGYIEYIDDPDAPNSLGVPYIADKDGIRANPVLPGMITDLVRSGTITVPFRTTGAVKLLEYLWGHGHPHRELTTGLKRSRTPLPNTDRRMSGHRVMLSELNDVGRNPERRLSPGQSAGRPGGGDRR